MRRRDFLTAFGGAMAIAPVVTAAWPQAARAQQAMPVIGFLRNTSPDEAAQLVAAFHKGLQEAGYVEGRNVQVEYRWTGGRTEQLPTMAADLVARKVSVIVALGNTPAVRAAKTATATIPVVFMIGTDPVELGLVASLNHPGGNVTGVVNLNLQLAQKWVEVLHQVRPAMKSIALLINPQNPATSEGYTREVQTAARGLGMQVHVLHAARADELDAAFRSVKERGAGALIIVADVLFFANIAQLAALSLQHAVPAIFPFREFAAAGGLMSYGTDLADTYRLAGAYTARIIKGEKPADLPVQQATKVELIVNLKTAKALGIDIPMALFARADEVIE